MGFRKVFYFITSKCNQYCIHCYLYKQGHVNHSSLFTFRNVLNIMPEEIRFTGGEPTLHPKINSYVEMASKIGLKTTILSNGQHDNDEFYIKLNDTDTFLWLSLCGTNNASHNHVTNNTNGYSNVLKAIQKCNNFNISFGMNVLLTREVIENIKYLFDIANNNKIKNIKFHRLTPPYKITKEVKSIIPSKYTLLEFIHNKDELRNENKNINLRFPVYENTIDLELTNKYGCFLEADEPLITITENGAIYPCCLLINYDKYIIGNINDIDAKLLNHKLEIMLLINKGSFMTDCIAFEKADGIRNCPLRFG